VDFETFCSILRRKFLFTGIDLSPVVLRVKSGAFGTRASGRVTWKLIPCILISERWKGQGSRDYEKDLAYAGNLLSTT
jgi:hypothetical protein